LAVSSTDDELLEPPPPEISELVTVCVESVLAAVDFQLDFSPDTVSVLDHYVSIARTSIQDRPELLPLLARTLGAYFGELLRRELPGFWRLPSANVHDWAVCGRPVFLWQNPVGVAFDALTGTTDHEGPRSRLHVAPEYQEALSARLATLPPVSEEEYVSFATRLEVVQLAVETLKSALHADGYQDTEFTLGDYEAELEALRTL
jgi:hypothetical protein